MRDRHYGKWLPCGTHTLYAFLVDSDNTSKLDSLWYRRFWIAWVKKERKVRNGELPIAFIIDDDGEG
jgi:hypothetical protein